MNTMSLNILTKMTNQKGGLSNADMADKGGGEVEQMLKLADKRGWVGFGRLGRNALHELSRVQFLKRVSAKFT